MFADISLPLPLKDYFVYEIPEHFLDEIIEGGRTIVPFGSKVYTGIVLNIHNNKPLGYKVKQIYQVVDTSPVVNPLQIDFYKWLAKYYLVSLGEIFKTVLPKYLFLESETIIEFQDTQFQSKQRELSDDAFLIIEALQTKKSLRISEVQKIIGQKNIFKTLDELVNKGVINLTETHSEKYRPKTDTFFTINSDYVANKTKTIALLNDLKRATKQKEIVLTLFSMSLNLQKMPIHLGSFIKNHGFNRQNLKVLEQKGIVSIFEQSIDRVQFDSIGLLDLKPNNSNIIEDIHDALQKKKPVLLHGMSFPEDTTVYLDLVESYAKNNNQILLILPENFSVIQFIEYFKLKFSSRLLTYHAKMTQNERVEVWKKVLNHQHEPQIIIGTKLALFLPFSNLKLVMVEDEHVPSYKQSFTSFRYHCRDSAIVLAQKNQADIILNSLTPSIETFYNASHEKFSKVILQSESTPKYNFEVVNLKESLRRKKVKGHFSDTLIERIRETTSEGKKVILFQNRRGYAPAIQCNTCGSAIYCIHCDVTLTYYKSTEQLKCHYCNYTIKKPDSCPNCGSTDLQDKGLGTEQLEQETLNLFPDLKVIRLDYDTTRKKESFAKIINQFKSNEANILIGTQILNSGINFKNVGLLGIVNFENLLSFPDFRVYERAFQVISQLIKRSLPKKVLIQAYNPVSNLIKILEKQDYEALYTSELTQREQFKYPPYFHLTKITLKSNKEQSVAFCGDWFVKSLQTINEIEVLGPSLPPVAKVKNEYFRDILIKQNSRNIFGIKGKISKLIKTAQSIGEFRSIKIALDVDCY